MHGSNGLIYRQQYAKPFDLPPFAIMDVITHCPAFISPVGGFETGFFTKIDDQLLGIGKIGGVYKNG